MKKLGELLHKAEGKFGIESVDFEYDCGDKRSYGRLTVTLVVLNVGTVKLDCFPVGSGGGLETGWSEKVLVDGEQVEFENCPNVEVPHYYAGVNTCNRWEERASEVLDEDLGQWLAEEWGCWEQSLPSPAS